MRQLVLLYGILVFSISAWSTSEIKGVDTKKAGKSFTAIYTVSEPIEEGALKINYRPRSVELLFKGINLKGAKSIVRVDHPLVDRVYSSNKEGNVFSRIILKEGLVAMDFQKRVGFEVKGSKVFLKISEENIFPAAVADLDEALDIEVAKVLSQDMPEKVLEVPIAKKPLKESEIPVLIKAEEKKSKPTSPYSRLIMSLVIIGLFAAAAAMMTRWWKKRSGPNTDNSKIRMISQHFLGPRRSLAIVRVAGESMLIGITDQNINMIKSLSLLDEESLDNIDPTKSFQDVLQASSDTQPEPAEEEDFSFKQIKDRISSRVKDMRPL